MESSPNLLLKVRSHSEHGGVHFSLYALLGLFAITLTKKLYSIISIEAIIMLKSMQYWTNTNGMKECKFIP